MEKKILCSTGTMVGRANGFNYRLVLENEKEICADGFELMMLKAFYGRLPEIANDFQRADTPIVTIHFEKDITALLGLGDEEDRKEGLRLFTANVDMAQAVGADKAVFHLWDGRFSEERVQSGIALLEILYEICEKRGVSLLVENVPCRISPYSLVSQISKKYPFAKFTFDTRHASFLRELTVFLKSPIWQEKIRHLHISDYSGETVPGMWGVTRPILHPGEGIIDFDAFFASMPPYDGDTIALESPVMAPDGSISIPKLNQTLEFLRQKIKNI